MTLEPWRRRNIYEREDACRAMNESDSDLGSWDAEFRGSSFADGVRGLTVEAVSLRKYLESKGVRTRVSSDCEKAVVQLGEVVDIGFVVLK